MSMIEQGTAAPVSRRFLAWLIDFILVFSVLVALVYSAVASVVNDAMSTALKAVLKADAQVVLDALWPVIAACLAAAAIQFAYQAIGLRLRGQTLGKALLDLRVRGRRSSLGWGHVFRRAALTTLAETGLWSLACVILFLGQPLLGFLVWLLGFAAFAINLAPMPGAARRTVIDRLSGTMVVRAATLQAVAQAGARMAIGGVQAVNRAQMPQRAAQTGGQVAQRAAQTGGQVAQRAAQTGGEVAQRAAQAGGQAASKAKRLWAERQARRNAPHLPGEEADGVAEAQPLRFERPPDRP